MRELGKISTALFDKIRSRFENVRLGDDTAKATADPEDARFFNFDYVDENGKNYGNVTMSIVDEKSLKVYFSKNISDTLEGNELQQWFQFLRGLREFARRNLLTFDTRDITKGNLNINDLKQQSKADSTFNKSDVNTGVVGESRMWGTSRSSYQECGPAKIIVRHSTNVDEAKRGSRTRNIEAVFIESHNGERRLLPFKNLHGARAMARHCSNGGDVSDQIGESISGIVKEMSAMTHFVREAKRRQFEDVETGRMAESAIKRYQTLKSQLRHLDTRRGYSTYTENFTPPTDINDEVDVQALRERFVRKVYDDRFNDALPYVYKAFKEDQNQPPMVNEFEEWANQITEDAFEDDDQVFAHLKDLFEKPIAVGQDGIDASMALQPAIGDWTLESELHGLSQTLGADADARQTVLIWMHANGMGDMAEKLEELVDHPSGDAVQPDQASAPAGSQSEPEQASAPAGSQPTESADPLDFMRQLAKLIK